MDIDRALSRMPSHAKAEVSKLIAKYNETGNQEYAKMAIALVEQFDDSAARELTEYIKRR